MKKIKHILTCIVLSLSLSGCSLFDRFNSSSSQDSSSEPAKSEYHVHHGGEWQLNENEHWKVCEECGERYEVCEHEYTAYIDEEDTVHYQCYCGDSDEEPYSSIVTESFTIDSSNFRNYGNYDTGNYGIKAISSWNFEYYRIVSSSGYCFAIKPNFQADDDTLNGAFYNISSCGLIWSISLTYTADDTFSVWHGNSSVRAYEEELPAKNNETKEILCGKSRFFMIDSKDAYVYISSIVINYVPDDYHTLENVKPNLFNYRISPTVFTGDLVDGESQVTVPTSIQISKNSYTVLATKTYTYYSFNYVRDHNECKSEAAMTTKEDVANYYLAFHRFPANYATNDDKSIVEDVFGSDTRIVQTFERTDGYAEAVPFNGNPPTYHELDIALPGAYYSIYGGRGVGRVVVWDNGFTNYGDDVVAVYTDDHYNTFQEYLNYGSFGDRFNAEGMRVSHAYNPTITLPRG